MDNNEGVWIPYELKEEVVDSSTLCNLICNTLGYINVRNAELVSETRDNGKNPTKKKSEKKRGFLLLEN